MEERSRFDKMSQMLFILFLLIQNLKHFVELNESQIKLEKLLCKTFRILSSNPIIDNPLLKVKICQFSKFHMKERMAQCRCLPIIYPLDKSFFFFLFFLFCKFSSSSVSFINMYLFLMDQLETHIFCPSPTGIKQYHVVVPHHPMPNVVFNAKTETVVKIISSVSFQQCLIFSNMQTR